MRTPQVGDRCPDCGRPLELRRCLACEGKGTIKEGLFSKRETCHRCGGSGRVVECEYELSHQFSRNIQTLKTEHEQRLNKLRQQGPQGGVRCPTCAGTGGVMWMGRAGPCPTCGGRGTISGR